MKRIATHNSATGEKGTFWSFFVKIFSKTQTKTISEQFLYGCRYFDFRIKLSDKWKFAHGLWRSKCEIWDVLNELERHAERDVNKTYAYLTYEGKYSDEIAEKVIQVADIIARRYPHILITSVDAKYSGKSWNPFYVDYKHIKTYNTCPIPSKQGFIPLDGKHWQTFIPIPWLWNLIYTRNHEFNEEQFIFVDFL